MVSLLWVRNQLTDMSLGRSMREFPRITGHEKTLLWENDLPAGKVWGKKHHHVLVCCCFLLMNVFISATATKLHSLWVPMLTEGQRLSRNLPDLPCQTETAETAADGVSSYWGHLRLSRMQVASMPTQPIATLSVYQLCFSREPGSVQIPLCPSRRNHQ